jgi:hypothetical protein
MSNDTRARPVIGYWHVWTDAHGVSRQTRGEMTDFEMKTMSGAAPQWLDRFGAETATIIIGVLPVGWEGDWHENPKPQWIIPLSGAWQVETMDGQAVTMGPGDISFGEDQNCVSDERGRKGHFSRTIGDVPCVQMIVQLDVTPTVGQPGRWR